MEGMLPLHEYQKRAIDAIQHSVGGLALWLPMGMGKTRIVIEALKMMHRPKTLVVAPATVVKNVWKQEAEKWDAGVKVNLITGTPSQRRKKLEEQADIYVISRDLIKWLYNLYSAIEWDVLVIDESTSFKNPSTQRWRSLKRMARKFKKIILLSGTPNANGYIDLWAQYFLLDEGKRLGRYITFYKQQYFVPILINGYMVYKKPRLGATDIINEKVKDITFALKSEDWLKLPDTIPHTVRIEQTEKEKKSYMEMKKTYVLNAEVTAQNAAVLCGKLQQMANGFVYTDDGRTKEIGTSKLDMLKEIIDTATDNILVYYRYAEDRKRLTEAGGRELKSEKDMKAWNEGKIKFAIANPSSIGYGINLQHGGHHIVWYSLPWSLEVYAQANGRLVRQGQTQPVTITHMLTAGTVDEKIMNALVTKQTEMDALIDAVKATVNDG